MQNQKRQNAETYKSRSHEEATIALYGCRASASLAGQAERLPYNNQQATTRRIVATLTSLMTEHVLAGKIGPASDVVLVAERQADSKVTAA
jgi:hypothetical protein